MNESEYIEQIAAYLDEAMTPGEQTAFEARMQENPVLAREVDALRALGRHSREFFKKEALVQAIVSANRQAQASRPVWKRPAFGLGLAIAAGLALFLLLRPMLLHEKPLDHQALFTQYFEVYDESGLKVERGETDDTPLWQQAGNAYREGNFSTAQSGFLAIIQMDSTDVAARFYLANSLLATGRADVAIAHLQYIAGKEDFLYGRQAEWLLALAFIRENQPGKALPLLEEIQRGSDSLAIQANKLRKALEQ
ncbi:MAG: hypothetical protein R3B47_16390 [Bacteroidia bacterium]